MSLGGSKSDALNQAVAAAVNAGLTVVVAAGNDAKDAINYSPASEPSAFTVGSSAISDLGAGDSNWGKCMIPPPLALSPRILVSSANENKISPRRLCPRRGHH